jgi:hypothetical protein
VQAILFNKTQTDIKQDWEHGVQGVKPDAAATRIIYRDCQQMIEIHQHSGQHQNVSWFPALTKKKLDNDRRNDKMQGEVYDLSCLVYVTQ